MPQRIALFDRARGLAIVLMVFANTTPVLGTEYVGPFWLRVLCSIPAPLFVMLVGMMIAKTALNQPPQHYIKRSAHILILAAAINVFIHQTSPFQNIEILYLIGLGIPIIYLVNILKTPFILFLCLLIFMMTALLQFCFPFDFKLIKTYPAWQLWLTTGWFPLLPWLGIMSLGLVFYRLYDKNRLFNDLGVWLSMTGLFFWGVALLYVYPNMPMTPNGYQELFYPPTLSFVCIAIPIVWLILFALNKIETPQFSGLNFLALLGQHSLFIYTLHLFFIFWIIGPLFYPFNSIAIFWGINFLHLSILASMTYLLSLYLHKFKK